MRRAQACKPGGRAGSGLRGSYVLTTLELFGPPKTTQLWIYPNIMGTWSILLGTLEVHVPDNKPRPTLERPEAHCIATLHLPDKKPKPS